MAKKTTNNLMLSDYEAMTVVKSLVSHGHSILAVKVLRQMGYSLDEAMKLYQSLPEFESGVQQLKESVENILQDAYDACDKNDRYESQSPPVTWHSLNKAKRVLEGMNNE